MDLKKQIPKPWKPFLKEELTKDYFISLQNFLDSELKEGKEIFPAKKDLFRAFNLVSPDSVKVVILGQDPYHNTNQAHGLSFSVPKGIKIPPSLRNIYKELESSKLGFKAPQHGDLTAWAEQGVLLLNSILTVEAHKAGSHQKKGWESFTDKIIEIINTQTKNTVFMLWGAYAQKKGKHIDRDKHKVLESVHPSPLSAYRGFLGCEHFSEANQYLKKQTQTPIDWSL